MKHLILLLILFLILFLTGCNRNTRISNLNTIEILKAQQIMADKILDNPAVQEALAETEGDPLKTVSEIKLLAESGERALNPVKDMLEIEATFLGMGKAEKLEPDVNVEDIIKNPVNAMAQVDFRTKLANEEVKHHPVKRFKDSFMGKYGQGIGAVLMGLLMTYLGASKFKGMKKTILSVTEDRDKNRLLAKNSIHYAKDIEKHAKDETLKGVALTQAIDNSRTNSMQDQLKHGLTEHMDYVLGEVKRERKT